MLTWSNSTVSLTGVLCYFSHGAVAITSPKKKNKKKKTHDKALLCGKKYCAQCQLKVSWCLTHNLCAISIGFIQCDNCAIALYSNTIKACSRFWVHGTCTTEHSFPMQTRKITENKQRFTVDLWCEQTRLHKLPECVGINTTTHLAEIYRSIHG